MEPEKLKVVKIIDPSLCTNCPFAWMAEVEFANGATKKMLYCRRLDCDNWDYANWEKEEWRSVWGDMAD